MNKKNLRGQEEMVGFVLIVVLVSVIFVVFLGMYLRQPAKEYPSREAENFLHSSLDYTSECKPSSEIVYDLKDLIKACINNENCLNGKTSCKVLNETYTKLIESSFKIGEEKKYKGYEFKIYQNVLSGTGNVIVNITQTPVNSGNMVGARIVPASLSNYEISLKLYY